MARSLVEGETIRVTTPLTVLGSGAFGTVCVAEFRATAEGPWHPCALKLLSAADAAAVDGELDALAALPPHPNIVRLIGKTRNATKVGIATELLAGGSLHARLEEATRLNKPPSTETRLRWCMDVAEGLAEMHRYGLVHGDIKTFNVMMDKKGSSASAKLIDFGLVKAVHGSVPETSYAGTLNFSAPELIPDSGHRSVRTVKADVYAFGCLVYSIFSRRQPFHEQLAHFGTSTSKKLGPEVLARVGPLLRGDGGRTPLRPNMDDLEADFTPEGLRGLLSRCWLTDHKKRPTIKEVLAVLESLNSGASVPFVATEAGSTTEYHPVAGGGSTAAPVRESFAMVSSCDLFAIKKSATGSGTTEVHVLSAASGYKDFALHTATGLHETPGDTFAFAVAENRDLFAIKKSATGSGTTEVHVLSAASGYKDFALQTATGLQETPGNAFAFLVAENHDLPAVKK